MVYINVQHRHSSNLSPRPVVVDDVEIGSVLGDGARTDGHGLKRVEQVDGQDRLVGAAKFWICNYVGITWLNHLHLRSITHSTIEEQPPHRGQSTPLKPVGGKIISLLLVCVRLYVCLDLLLLMVSVWCRQVLPIKHTLINSSYNQYIIISLDKIEKNNTYKVVR